MTLPTLLTAGAAGVAVVLMLSGALPCPLSSAAIDASAGGTPSQARSGSSRIGSPTVVEMPPSSGAAPIMRWTDGDGTERSLADYKGKVVLVNFWATWCPPCRREIPDLIRLRDSLHRDGLEIIGISIGERADPGTTVEQHVERYATGVGISYPLLVGDGTVADAFGGVRALPTSFLIGRDGRIAEVIVGARDGQTFRALIERELSK